MINMTPMFEFQIKRFAMTRQKVINRRAGMIARQLAPDPLKAQYAICRARCQMIKDRIMKFKSRATSMARRLVR